MMREVYLRLIRCVFFLYFDNFVMRFLERIFPQGISRQHSASRRQEQKVNTQSSPAIGFVTHAAAALFFRYDARPHVQKRVILIRLLLPCKYLLEAFAPALDLAPVPPLWNCFWGLDYLYRGHGVVGGLAVCRVVGGLDWG